MMAVIHTPLGAIAATGTTATIDQTAQPTSVRAASGVAVELAIAPLRTNIAGLDTRVVALETETADLTVEIENA